MNQDIRRERSVQLSFEDYIHTRADSVKVICSGVFRSNLIVISRHKRIERITDIAWLEIL